MTPEGIAAKVAYGYGKAGQKLGPIHTLYRPILPSIPALDGQCVITTLPFISSATPAGDFRRPAKYTEPLRYGLFDPRQTLPGDYIDGPSGTLFVASQMALEIPMLVQCETVISIGRPPGNAGSGIKPYGGRVTSTDVPLLNQWPASVTQGGRTQAGRADLPSDTPMKGYVCLLPSTMDLILRTSDHVTDDQGRQFVVDAAERSELGWRLELVLSVA